MENQWNNYGTKVFQTKATRSSRDRKLCDKRKSVTDTGSLWSTGNQSRALFAMLSGEHKMYVSTGKKFMEKEEGEGEKRLFVS